MITPSLPDQADEPSNNQPKTVALAIAGILILVITMVVLHLTGIVA